MNSEDFAHIAGMIMNMPLHHSDHQIAITALVNGNYIEHEVVYMPDFPEQDHGFVESIVSENTGVSFGHLSQYDGLHIWYRAERYWEGLSHDQMVELAEQSAGSMH